jgi:hypothetical protein
MLRSLRGLRGYALRAQDGKVGQVDDFYLDDLEWVVRYVVLDTGNWLNGKRVLLSPLALGEPDWETGTLHVHLLRAQVEGSPSISADRPVSRQVEAELHRYFRWSPYWESPTPGPGADALAAAQALALEVTEESISGEKRASPHLRSSKEVAGYHIRARDGEIGHVADFVVEDATWHIRYLVVDTHNWLPGRKVLVSPAWVEEVDWAERVVAVDLSRQTIQGSPNYDPEEPINHEYEGRLYDYYGRPKYWR